MKTFLYEFIEGGLLRIRAKKKPSIETQSRSGTWVVYEWHNGEFQMPCFPEVTWPIIRDKMIYIGELKNNE